MDMSLTLVRIVFYWFRLCDLSFSRTSGPSPSHYLLVGTKGPINLGLWRSRETSEGLCFCTRDGKSRSHVKFE
jgi:hypothetical protein